MQGIYRIAMADGRCYVGHSTAIAKRWKGHLVLLRKGKHHSPHLQRAWTKHGEPAFVFEVLEECVAEQLLVREQHWIDTTGAAFNCARVAGSRKGVPQSREAIERVRAVHIGRKNTPETIARMSAAAMGNQRNLGRAATPRMRANMASVGQANAGAKRAPLSAEHKEKVAAKQRGVPRPYARGPASPERREAMRVAALANSENRRRAAHIRWAKAREATLP